MPRILIQNIDANLNDKTESGYLIVIHEGHTIENSPDYTDGILIVFAYGQNYIKQDYISYTSNIYTRISWGGVWRNWIKIATT